MTEQLITYAEQLITYKDFNRLIKACGGETFFFDKVQYLDHEMPVDMVNYLLIDDLALDMIEELTIGEYVEWSQVLGCWVWIVDTDFSSSKLMVSGLTIWQIKKLRQLQEDN